MSKVLIDLSPDEIRIEVERRGIPLMRYLGILGKEFDTDAQLRDLCLTMITLIDISAFIANQAGVPSDAWLEQAVHAGLAIGAETKPAAGH